MSPAGRDPRDSRRRGWQQQTIGIIIIALIVFALIVVRYHRALLK